MADNKTGLDSQLCSQLLQEAGFTPGTPEWLKAAQERFKPTGDGVTYFDTRPSVVVAKPESDDTP